MTTATSIDAGRPTPDEYNSYYAQYVNRVPDRAILDLLVQQLNTTRSLLAPLTPDQSGYRPKPEDWNIVEVVGHLVDSERVFAYRALCFARGDTTPLPSFDQDLYVANAGFSRRPLADLLDEFATVRNATVALLRTLEPAAWLRQGTANANPVSVRALAYIIAGHELHHVNDFGERYRVV